MIHSDETFMETHRDDYESQAYAEHMELQAHMQQEHEAIPVIDIWALQPSIATSEQIANNIIEAIKEGRISPLEFAVKKKCITDALDMAFANAEVKNMAIEEVEKFGKAGATCLGATLKVTSTRKYDYSADPKWSELNESIAGTKAKIKEQEERVKIAVKTNSSLIDQDTGEVIAQVVPAPETTSVSVSFKKK